MEASEKVRENRLRRMAQRQGYKVKKSPRRDPRALDYGVYWIVNEKGAVIFGGKAGVSMDELEAWLTRD